MKANYLSILVGMLCAGCVNNPKFVRPDDLAIESYTQTSLCDESTVGPAIQYGAEIPSQWWELFRSDKLNQAIQTALLGSPTLKAAESTLRQAQEQTRAKIGTLFIPQFDLNASADQYNLRNVSTRRPCIGSTLFEPCPNSPLAAKEAAAAFPGFSIHRLPSVYNLLNTSIQVSYNFDLFGGSRLQAESARQDVEYQDFELKAARLTLIANVSTTAFTEAALRAQLDATRKIVALQEARLVIMESQRPLGGVSGMDLLGQRSQLEQTRARLPSLEYDLETTHSQLAVYLGKFPTDQEVPSFHLADFSLPKEIPVSIPSLLVRQRPDILAAEAQLRKASAEVGVATANMFPQISLTAGFGPFSLNAAPLISLHTTLLTLGAALAQPIFHGGALVAKRKAALAAYEASSSNYFNTILQGFKNVGDSLQALRDGSETLRCYESAEKEACSSWTITQQQFELGGVNAIAVLDSERQYRELLSTAAQARGMQLSDVAALFQSLGGGWWSTHHEGPVAGAHLVKAAEPSLNTPLPTP